MVHDKKSLFANEAGDLLEFLVRVFALDQPGVERRFRFVRNDVGGLLADVAAANSANVERRLLQQLHKFLAAAVGLGDAEFALKVGIVDRHGVERALFQWAEWSDVVVITGNQHAAIFVFHRSEQPRKHHRGIGRPISVMAAVQRSDRTVHGDVQADVATIPKENQRPARWDGRGRRR